MSVTSGKSKLRTKKEADLLETAWGLIANVNGGDWMGEKAEWIVAANKFRDAYNAWLNGYVATLPPPEAK